MVDVDEPEFVSEHEVEAGLEEIPLVDKHIQHELEGHGGDKRRAYHMSSDESSSSSSSSSSLSSSSSSSTSSMSSSANGDPWVDDEGYHTMDETEVIAYERWVNERRDKKRR